MAYPPPQQYGQPQYGAPQGTYGAPPGSQQYPVQQQYGAPPPGQYAAAPPPRPAAASWYTIYNNMIQPHERQEMSAWFSAIDVDHSGHITANEIQKCTFANVPLGFETASKLVRVFDKDHNGWIGFTEYCAMHKFLSLMQQAFFAGDTDRSGRLDAREIHHALSVGRMQVAFQAVNALYNKYNRDGYGVSFGDFLQLVAHIASAKSVFNWENQAQGSRGAVSVNFDKFLEMTGNI